MASLWFDSSVAYRTADFRRLCTIAKSRAIECYVPAEVHLEMNRKLRQEKGAEFSPDFVSGTLRSLGAKVIDLFVDQAAAERWARLLWQRYPGADDFERAKKKTIGGELLKGFRVLPGWMPMSTDWLISLQARDAWSADDSIRVVVEDDGEEWKLLKETAPPCARSVSEALAWLESLPAAPEQDSYL